MRRRSLNFRLTAAAIGAVLLAVLVFGVGARIIVSNQMHSSLDRSLRQRAAEVARLSVSAPAVLSSPGALESPVSGRQLSVERPGSGLGLAIVKATADRHGGTVRASGSTVTIALPLAPAGVVADSSREPVGGAVAKR